DGDQDHQDEERIDDLRQEAAADAGDLVLEGNSLRRRNDEIVRRVGRLHAFTLPAAFRRARRGSATGQAGALVSVIMEACAPVNSSPDGDQSGIGWKNC